MDLDSDLETAAKEAAGNWKKFRSFAWHAEPEDGDKWCIVITTNRDDCLLGKSNHDAIKKSLEPFDDAREVEFAHWGNGWVAGFVVRVYDADGKVTSEFTELHRIACSLASYGCLDEEDVSNREYAATLANIGSEGYALTDASWPEGWETKVFSWLWDNDQESVAPVDGGGGYPSREAIRAAVEALGWTIDE